MKNKRVVIKRLFGMAKTKVAYRLGQDCIFINCRLQHIYIQKKWYWLDKTYMGKQKGAHGPFFILFKKSRLFHQNQLIYGIEPIGMNSTDIHARGNWVALVISAVPLYRIEAGLMHAGNQCFNLLT